MKRYFKFESAPPRNAYRPRGAFVWMSLPSGGCIGVLEEEGAERPLEWSTYPALTETTPAGIQDFGCLLTDTMYQAAVKLGRVHEAFYP